MGKLQYFCTALVKMEASQIMNSISVAEPEKSWTKTLSQSLSQGSNGSESTIQNGVLPLNFAATADWLIRLLTELWKGHFKIRKLQVAWSATAQHQWGAEKRRDCWIAVAVWDTAGLWVPQHHFLYTAHNFWAKSNLVVKPLYSHSWRHQLSVDLDNDTFS